MDGNSPEDDSGQGTPGTPRTTTQSQPTETGTEPQSTSPGSLERSPFAPRNPDLLDPIFYPGAKPFGESGPSQTETEVRTQLRETFTMRFNGNQQRVAGAMSAFDDPVLRAKCADHELRGATVVLQGTSGQAAFDAVMNDPQILRIEYTNVAEIVGSTRALARTMILPSGSMFIQFDERLAGEDIRALAPTMLHETFHSDPEVSAKEELVANTVEAINYGEFVLEAPTLARQNTELVRRANTELMARLNSRDETGAMRLLVSQGPLLPDSTRTDIQPFADLTIYTNDDYPTWEAVPNTPGNPQLHSVFEAQTGTEGRGADFDDQTIATLDDSQVVLSSREQRELLEAVELAPTELSTSPKPTEHTEPN